MSHNDFDFEPIPGLPAHLPAGEKLLWQGSPNWRSLAVRSYHVRKVAVYFLILMAWRVATGASEGHSASAILLSCAFLAVLGAVAIAVLALLARLSARATVYSITSRRVLLRHGVAVPLTLNLPFTSLDQVGLRSFSDGTGDISFVLPKSERVGYLITWPHLKPGDFTHPQPSFRALPDAAAAAKVLGAALNAAPQAAPAPEAVACPLPRAAAAAAA